MQSATLVDRPLARRIGVYGWGVVAPGARDVRALETLLCDGRSALGTGLLPDLGHGLFAVGDPDFSFDDYAGWIAERHGEAYVARMAQQDGRQRAVCGGSDHSGTPVRPAAGSACARAGRRVSSAYRLRRRRRDAIVTVEAELDGIVGVKLMLGIGGITACIVMRAC